MGIKRLVDIEFWEDPRIIDRFSIEDRYFYLYLLTNPNTTQLGIYSLPIKTISDKTGFTREVVLTLLERFEEVLNMIRYNHETQEISVIESLRSSIIKGGVAVERLLEKELTKIKSTKLIQMTLDHNRRYFDISGKAFDRKVRDLLQKEIEVRKNYCERQQVFDSQINNENEYQKDKEKKDDIKNESKNQKDHNSLNLSVIDQLREDAAAFHDSVVNNPEIPIDEDLIEPFLEFCKIKGLHFTRAELTSYCNWLRKFDLEMVREAVLRSIDKKDIFSYSMKILWNWKNLGLKTLFHVNEYDEGYYKD